MKRNIRENTIISFFQKEFYITFFLLISAFLCYGQNLVQNWNFEEGLVPTQEGQAHAPHLPHWDTRQLGGICAPGPGRADLFDTQYAGSDCQYGIPVNKWAGPVGIRPDGEGHRYVGFSSSERVVTKLTQPIQGNTQYEVSLWVYGINGNNNNPCTQNYVKAGFSKPKLNISFAVNQCWVQRQTVIYQYPIQKGKWQKVSAVVSVPSEYITAEHQWLDIALQPTGKGISASAVFIDDIVVRKYVYVPTCTEVAALTKFDIVGIQMEEGKIESLTFKMENEDPSPLVTLWWGIFEANNCDLEDTSHTGTALRPIVGGTTYVVNNEDEDLHQVSVNKCYVVQHGVYTDECPWKEYRKKIVLIVKREE